MWTDAMVAMALVWLWFVALVLIDHFWHRDSVAMRRYERQRRHFKKYMEADHYWIGDHGVSNGGNVPPPPQ